MSKKTKEFKFAQVDRNLLDDERVSQEEMMGHYCALLADAKLDRDRAKSALKVKEAELGQKIRSKPEKYGLEKATNEPVNAEVIIQLQKSDEQEDYFLAEHKVNMLGAAVERLRERSKTLTDLTYLHGMGYFAGRKKTKASKEDMKSMKNKRMARERVRSDADDEDD